MIYNPALDLILEKIVVETNNSQTSTAQQSTTQVNQNTSQTVNTQQSNTQASQGSNQQSKGSKKANKNKANDFTILKNKINQYKANFEKINKYLEELNKTFNNKKFEVVKKIKDENVNLRRDIDNTLDNLDQTKFTQSELTEIDNFKNTFNDINSKLKSIEENIKRLELLYVKPINEKGRKIYSSGTGNVLNDILYKKYAQQPEEIKVRIIVTLDNGSEKKELRTFDVVLDHYDPAELKDGDVLEIIITDKALLPPNLKLSYFKASTLYKLVEEKKIIVDSKDYFSYTGRIVSKITMVVLAIIVAYFIILSCSHEIHSFLVQHHIIQPTAAKAGTTATTTTAHTANTAHQATTQATNTAKPAQPANQANPNNPAQKKPSAIVQFMHSIFDDIHNFAMTVIIITLVAVGYIIGKKIDFLDSTFNDNKHRREAFLDNYLDMENYILEQNILLTDKLLKTDIVLEDAPMFYVNKPPVNNPAANQMQAANSHLLSNNANFNYNQIPVSAFNKHYTLNTNIFANKAEVAKVSPAIKSFFMQSAQTNIQKVQQFSTFKNIDLYKFFNNANPDQVIHNAASVFIIGFAIINIALIAVKEMTNMPLRNYLISLVASSLFAFSIFVTFYAITKGLNPASISTIKLVLNAFKSDFVHMTHANPTLTILIGVAGAATFFTVLKTLFTKAQNAPYRPIPEPNSALVNQSFKQL